MHATADHPAFAETELASTVGLHRHRPDARSMLHEYAAAEVEAVDVHVERVVQAYRNGVAYGKSDGFRAGFVKGTRRGMLYGAIAVSLVVAIAELHLRGFV